MNSEVKYREQIPSLMVSEQSEQDSIRDVWIQAGVVCMYMFVP